MDPIASNSCPYPLGLAALRGDSIGVVIRLIDARTGRPISLTGYSGTAGIYQSPNSSIPTHALTVVVDQAAVGQETTGLVAITAAGGETTLWLEAGAWSLVLELGAVRKTLVAGPWTLAGPSMLPAVFVCGLCPVVGFGSLGTGCDVASDGYTSLVLPYPAGACGC
jgi:hypothetical protein